jgi:hypothetical protein
MTSSSRSQNNFNTISSCLMFIVLTRTSFCLFWQIIRINLPFSSFLTFPIIYSVLYCYLFVNSVPNFINTISIIKLFKNTIASDHYKIEIILGFKTFYVWLTYNYVWISPVLGSFSFNVSKSFRY